VVNTHRMLHRAWEDFTTWGWAKRNVVSDAHPPRVPRKGRKVWTVAQLQTFLQRARSDRFFALWVLEATSGMRRCELAGARLDLLDLDAGTLTIEMTRVVVDGRVIESDGKTETPSTSWRSTRSPWPSSRRTSSSSSRSGGTSGWVPRSRRAVLLAALQASPLTPSPGGSRSSPRRPGCPRSTCTTCGTAMPPRAAMPGSTGRR
jgi:integrase